MNERDYVTRLLLEENVVDAIRADEERLLTIIPELRRTVGFDHRHPHHHLDVWEHTLLALSVSERSLSVRLALLLHDSGKPHCFTEGEVRHFRGHHIKSAEIAESVLRRLDFDIETASEVITLVRRHDTAMTERDIEENLRLSKLLFEVQRCDTLAHNPLHNERRMEYLARTENLISAREKQ